VNAANRNVRGAQGGDKGDLRRLCSQKTRSGWLR
jgi:hypothetical protein